ncbi:MAG: hypothetical protein ACFFG0_38885, partial [Candidatus Thorarchaeota archaeon]
RPNKEDLRKVMEKSLSVPKYLIMGVTPQNGYCPIRESPDWLVNYKILILKNNKWKGTNNGNIITITYNPEIGLQGFKEE